MEGKEVYGGTMSKRTRVEWRALIYALFVTLPAIFGWFMMIFMLILIYAPGFKGM